jgi:hypothetical protein
LPLRSPLAVIAPARRRRERAEGGGIGCSASITKRARETAANVCPRDEYKSRSHARVTILQRPIWAVPMPRRFHNGTTALRKGELEARCWASQAFHAKSGLEKELQDMSLRLNAELLRPGTARPGQAVLAFPSVKC